MEPRQRQQLGCASMRSMLTVACDRCCSWHARSRVTRNRRRGLVPFESAVPRFAEYLQSERGFAESTIRNYRRHLSEFAQYLIQTGVTSFSQLSPPVLSRFRRGAHAENGSAHAPRFLLSFASVVASILSRELSQKRSSTISSMAGLRPRPLPSQQPHRISCSTSKEGRVLGTSNKRQEQTRCCN